MNPIDAVYTWVDGNDPAWLERKNRRLRELRSDEAPVHTNAASDNRFRDNNELRYSLRSLEKYAPWIRNVYLVTDRQRPDWIDTSRVKIVDHTEIFPDNADLPVFSSTPIEMCIHRIPNLSECFISFNDDFILGRKVTPEDYFSPEGRPRIWADRISRRKHRILIEETLDNVSMHSVRDARARRLALEKYNFRQRIKVRHYPRPVKRSILDQLWETFPEIIEANLRSVFRSRTDTIILPSLYSYFALATEQADLRIINSWPRVLDFLRGRIRHIGTTSGDRNFKWKLFRIGLFKPVTFCVNDGVKAPEEDVDAMLSLLKKRFPEKGSCEKA